MEKRNKTKQILTKIEERFGVFFKYKNKAIIVYRLNANKNGPSDILITIELGDNITKLQFEDECTCWCDQNIA